MKYVRTRVQPYNGKRSSFGESGEERVGKGEGKKVEIKGREVGKVSSRIRTLSRGYTESLNPPARKNPSTDSKAISLNP